MEEHRALGGDCTVDVSFQVNYIHTYYISIWI